MLYKGSCHCGRIRIAVEGEVSGAMECDCSICRMTGFLHWIVEEDRVRVTIQDDAMSAYVWGTGAARHLFCAKCGVAPLRRPRSSPTSYSVNLRCLEGIDLATIRIGRFDGKALPLP